MNRHIIAANKKHGNHEPPISVRCGGKTQRANVVEIAGLSRVIYRPDRPLRCGATVWIETQAEVTVIGNREGKQMTVYQEILRGKGLFDGAATLGDMVVRLQHTMEAIMRMAADGIELAEPITDDYAFFETEDAAIAEKYGFEEIDDIAQDDEEE